MQVVSEKSEKPIWIKSRSDLPISIKLTLGNKRFEPEWNKYSLVQVDIDTILKFRKQLEWSFKDPTKTIDKSKILTSVKSDHAHLNICIDKEVSIKILPVPETAILPKEFINISDHPNIAIASNMSSNPSIKGLKEGTATITSTYKDYQCKTEISVFRKPEFSRPAWKVQVDTPVELFIPGYLNHDYQYELINFVCPDGCEYSGNKFVFKSLGTYELLADIQLDSGLERCTTQIEVVEELEQNEEV